MLDIQLLRKDLPAAIAGLKRRGFDFDEAAFARSRTSARTCSRAPRSCRASATRSRSRSACSRARARTPPRCWPRSAASATSSSPTRRRSPAIQEKLDAFLRVIPNIPRAEVPEGRSSDDNVEVRRWGTPRTFDFAVKDHVDVGAGTGRARLRHRRRSSPGARFSVLKGGLARLHRALAQFMLATQTEEHGYTEVYVPYMVTGRVRRRRLEPREVQGRPLQDRGPRPLPHPDRGISGHQFRARFASSTRRTCR